MDVSSGLIFLTRKKTGERGEAAARYHQVTGGVPLRGQGPEFEIPYRGLGGMVPAKPPRAAQLCQTSSFHPQNKWRSPSLRRWEEEVNLNWMRRI